MLQNNNKKIKKPRKRLFVCAPDPAPNPKLQYPNATPSTNIPNTGGDSNAKKTFPKQKKRRKKVSQPDRLAKYAKE